MNENQVREEKRNNSQGIFYVVIGVATLVVTIVGATFAYFSATAGSNNEAITTGSATSTLRFEEVATGLKANLIPMDESNQFFVGHIGKASASCVDANSNNICSVYEFTITNPTTSNVTIYPTFTANTNGFANLKYAVFKGTADTIAASGVTLGGANPTSATTAGPLVVPMTPAPTQGTSHSGSASGTGNAVILNNMITELAGGNGTTDGGSVTFTIVLWIHEIQNDSGVTDGDQTAVDAGQSFAGTISFTTSNGTGGVTGELSA